MVVGDKRAAAKNRYRQTVLGTRSELMLRRTHIIGNESVPIQLAQCRFPGLAISSAKILIYFFK